MNLEWIWNEFHVLFQFYSKKKIFIPNSFQSCGMNFFSPHFIPISFLYYPFYSKFIPNISAWIYSMSIFMPILFQRKNEWKWNENGMKLEWNGNEFHVLFQFYSKQKIFIPYSFQYRGINFLSLHFMPISFRFIPNSFQNTWHFLRLRKTVIKRNENGIKWEWISFLFQFHSKKKYFIPNSFIFIPILFQEKIFIPNSFIFIPILFQEKIFIPNSFIFIPILFEEKIFIPNSFQYSIINFCFLHFMPISFLYYPFYAQYIGMNIFYVNFYADFIPKETWH